MDSEYEWKGSEMFSRPTSTVRADVPGPVVRVSGYLLSLLAMLALVALTGCATAPLREIGETTTVKLATVETGMTRDQVQVIMGTTMVQAKRGQMVPCPYRADAIITSDGRDVEILYYYTGNADLENERDHVIQYEELTPIVLEKGIVIGGGWIYLQRHYDQFGVPVPESQKRVIP